MQVQPPPFGARAGRVQYGPQHGSYGHVPVDAQALERAGQQLKPAREGFGAEILGFLYKCAVLGLMIGILAVLARPQASSGPTHVCQPSPLRAFVGVGHGRMVDAVPAAVYTKLQASLTDMLPLDLQRYANAITNEDFSASAPSTEAGAGDTPFPDISPLTRLRYQRLHSSSLDLMTAQMQFDFTKIIQTTIAASAQNRLRRLLDAAEDAPLVGPLFKKILQSKRSYEQRHFDSEEAPKQTLSSRSLGESSDVPLGPQIHRSLLESDASDQSGADSGGDGGSGEALDFMFAKMLSDKLERMEHHHGWLNLPQYCAALQTAGQCSAPSLSWKSYVLGVVIEVGTLTKAMALGQDLFAAMNDPENLLSGNSGPKLTLSNLYPGTAVFRASTNKLMMELQETIADSYSSPCVWTPL